MLIKEGICFQIHISICLNKQYSKLFIIRFFNSIVKVKFRRLSVLKLVPGTSLKIGYSFFQQKF